MSEISQLQLASDKQLKDFILFSYYKWYKVVQLYKWGARINTGEVVVVMVEVGRAGGEEGGLQADLPAPVYTLQQVSQGSLITQ